MFSRRAVLAGIPAAFASLPSQAKGWRKTFSGRWNNASGTPLQRRPPFTALAVSAAEAARYETSQRGIVQGVPGDDVGQDGAEWFTPGEPLLRVRGEARTSVIIDPPDGQLPYRPEGRRALITRLRSLDFDGPDSRPPSERCLVGFGDPAAAPMLYAPQTTGDYQFVQTADALVIRTEANHDIRIVSLGPTAPSTQLSAWQGVCQGHWEGETLVMVSTAFHQLEGLRSPPDQLYLSSNARVTERLTRTSPTEILYEFTVDDPAVFTRPWRGESVFRATNHEVLDYECHEGNYALGNILSGARAGGSK